MTPVIDGIGIATGSSTAGAKAVLGAARWRARATSTSPTILSGVTEGTCILSEEIFGPVAQPPAEAGKVATAAV